MDGKKFIFCVCFLVILVFLSPHSRADIVELDNGSTIIGKIEKIVDGKVHMETSFAGSLVIHMESVVSISSDTPLLVGLKSDEWYYGVIRYNKEETQVDTAEGSITVASSDVVSVWEKTFPYEIFQPRRKWRYEAGLDLAGRSGNTERFSTGGRIRATLQGKEDRLLFYLRGIYAREENEKTDDEIIGGIDFETRLNTKHLWYSRIELETDDIEDVELRTTLASGYGYYFLEKPYHVLKSRFGFLFRHDSYKDEGSDSTAGLDFGLSHIYEFDNLWKLITDIIYSPSLESLSDYLLYHESAFEAPIGGSEVWYLQLGLKNDYNSSPLEGNDRNDTTYFGRLVMKWE